MALRARVRASVRVMTWKVLRGCLAITVPVAGLVLAACSDASAPDPASSQDTQMSLGHVHGIGVNPADGALYAASHYGVFKFREDGSAHRVADRYQDTMGFTVVGPDRFLGSGHPDLREDLPGLLGLIESTDAAQTWTPVSLLGEADFHALEATAELVVGYDASSRALMRSRDGRSWVTVAKARLVDLALNPADSDRLLATTPRGELLEYSLSGGGPSDVPAPALIYVDWPRADLLVGVGPDGAIWASTDGGDGWESVAGPPGEPQAIDVEPGLWHVATDAGIFRSTDDGASWTNLVRPSG